MRICIIVNANAGSADRFEELTAAVAARTEFTSRMSSRKGEGLVLAQQAVDEGYDVVAAAGGDGTINEVVNGIMKADGRSTLGVVPLGTGNDLARMLDIPDDVHHALDLLRSGTRRTLDLYKVESNDRTIYGINAAAGGLAGQVDEAITTELKSNWGPLAYLIGAASVIPDLQEFETYISYDDGEREQVNAMNIIVANGRTLAGGKRAAPLSNPEDGLLDVIIVRKGSLVELGDAATRLVAGGFLKSQLVSRRRAKRVRIDSEPPMWFNVDGELITKETLTVTVQPKAIDVVVGPDYRAVVES